MAWKRWALGLFTQLQLHFSFAHGSSRDGCQIIWVRSIALNNILKRDWYGQLYVMYILTQLKWEKNIMCLYGRGRSRRLVNTKYIMSAFFKLSEMLSCYSSAFPASSYCSLPCSCQDYIETVLVSLFIAWVTPTLSPCASLFCAGKTKCRRLIALKRKEVYFGPRVLRLSHPPPLA